MALIAWFALWTPVSAQNEVSDDRVRLSATPFFVGQTGFIFSNSEDPGWFHFLLYDTQTGDATLPSGAWFGLSPGYKVAAVTVVPADGQQAFAWPIPSDPAVAGAAFYLQAAQVTPSLTFTLTSNRLDLGVNLAPAAGTDWLCTPSAAIDLATGGVTSAAYPIEHALARANPGDVIEVGPGSHPKFAIDKPWVDGQAPITIRAQVPGTRILRHNVPGSPTINLKRAGFINIEGFVIEASSDAGILCQRQQTTGHKSVHFIDCTIDGGYDWYTQSGYSAKWGVLGWDLDDFVWQGGAIQNIKQEHAFYLHNCKGDITIQDMEIRHVGRTAVQITARVWEGAEGAGKIKIKNVLVVDSNLGDGWAGGSAFTFAGRHRGSILLDGVTYVGGYDAALNQVARRTLGTGAFVSHYGDGSLEVPNGPITVKNCNLLIAPGGGDRDHLQVAATDSFTLQTSTITAGSRFALNISNHNQYPISLDYQSKVTGSCIFDGVTFSSYLVMLAAKGF